MWCTLINKRDMYGKVYNLHLKQNALKIIRSSGKGDTSWICNNNFKLISFWHCAWIDLQGLHFFSQKQHKNKGDVITSWYTIWNATWNFYGKFLPHHFSKLFVIQVYPMIWRQKENILITMHKQVLHLTHSATTKYGIVPYLFLYGK